MLLVLAGGKFLLPARLSAEGERPTAEQAAQAKQAVSILSKYCYKCHGVERKYPGLDVLDRETLLRPLDSNEAPFVKPSFPDDSRLYQKMTEAQPGDRMPPPGQPQPNEDETNEIREWIKAGASIAPAERMVRPVKGEEDILAAIAIDLESPSNTEPRFTRYFTLVHLWNDSSLSDDDLRLVRAAVSKLVNSLSDQPKITPPRIVDSKTGLVLAIDIRDYGWHAKVNQSPDAWSELLAAYPYGLASSSPAAQSVYEKTGSGLPYLRADWFVFHASRPPLYHALLRLPVNQTELEAQLKVNSVKNFRHNITQRAGFRKSGISSNNRLVQRQPIKPDVPRRAYWSSFDFASDERVADIFALPLGPLDYNPNPTEAFQHDGGEIIYHLPNGLSGYMLVNAKGDRIDEGPIKIVSDPQQFSGSPVIVNGISCMGCHKQGYLALDDTLRASYAKDASALGERVRKLHPPADVLNALLAGDRQTYGAALEDAVGDFLRENADDLRTFHDFPEPITQVAARYGRNLSFESVGRELLLNEQSPPPPPTIDQFKLKLADEQVFRILGLSPLATGEIVDRTVWEAVYHVTARTLDLGTPLRLAGPKLIGNSIDMNLVLIPAGKFTIGSPEEEAGRDFFEIQREAEIPSSFYLAATEVTQDQYLRVMGQTPSFFSNEGARKELVKHMMTGRFPVEKVSGPNAEKFCRMLSSLPAERAAGRSYRLPTAAEWEYACRAGTQTPYHVGMNLNGSQARIHDDRFPQPKCTVGCGSYQPNAFGLYDMHGNVAEWCSNVKMLPGGPRERVTRGGSWRSPANDCRSACSLPALEDALTDTIGFRVVCEIQ